MQISWFLVKFTFLNAQNTKYLSVSGQAVELTSYSNNSGLRRDMR